MLLKLCKMLLMNMIKEENLNGVALLTDTSFVAMYEFKQVSSKIFEFAELCSKYSK